MVSRLAARFARRKRFSDLTEQEVLALVISAEEEEAGRHRAAAARVSADDPDAAAVFEAMAAEEDDHRRALIALHRRRFGEAIPAISPGDVSGLPGRLSPVRLAVPGFSRRGAQAARRERDAEALYAQAARLVRDAQTRGLLGDLAAAEAGHGRRAEALDRPALASELGGEGDGSAHRRFVLTYVQPGLAGLMDGSVSTLAPIFATAFATEDTWTTFVVGLAASVGAGISMGFTEAVSDDGRISGRGSPVARGFACGIMTTVGGLGHALPYLIPAFWTATAIAMAVVVLELWAIAWIQNRYMQTPFWRAAFQVVLGGALVFAAGILIGNA